MTKTTKFQFQFDGATYTFEGEPKQVANVRRSVEAARAKMEAAVAQSTKRGRGRPRVEREPKRSQIIRAWAKEQGLTQAERGRLSAEVVTAFEAANPGK
jgi:hypothetical protein